MESSHFKDYKSRGEGAFVFCGLAALADRAAMQSRPWLDVLTRSMTHELEERMETLAIVVVIAGLALVASLVSFQRGRALKAELATAHEELECFSEIRDLQAKVRQLEADLQDGATQLETLTGALEREAAAIEQKRAELRSVESDVEMQSYGFYAPRYDFETAEVYSRALKENRAEQKALVKDDKAAHCSTNWSVSGSAAKGRKMVRQAKRLMLRAFNGECDAAIARVNYSNVDRIENRIVKAHAAINKLGQSNDIDITPAYLNLKLAELWLTHEHKVKKQEEKEEQQRIKEQMREEQKALKEIEKAQRQAEKEEAQKVAALEKARAQLVDAHGAQLAKLEELVGRMESELQEAIERKARAIARAQLTRSGHVYVISNVGSFGDGVYKIGMTRRLDPQERVKELSGSSVPFGYDVHAMIYCEDAPALEAALHQEFAARRVNMINHRREFFRVSLDEVRTAVAQHHGITTFVTSPEAAEYRQTMAMVNANPEVVSQAS